MSRLATPFAPAATTRPLVALPVSLWRVWRRWREGSEAEAHLRQLDDRMLRDIGLDRREIGAAVGGRLRRP